MDIKETGEIQSLFISHSRYFFDWVIVWADFRQVIFFPNILNYQEKTPDVEFAVGADSPKVWAKPALVRCTWCYARLLAIDLKTDYLNAAETTLPISKIERRTLCFSEFKEWIASELQRPPKTHGIFLRKHNYPEYL